MVIKYNRGKEYASCHSAVKHTALTLNILVARRLAENVFIKF